MEYRNSWMYGSLRYKAGFREEVDKFIEAAEKHAATLIENNDIILCPYRDCKNLIAFSDVSTIRPHLIMRGFVPDYTVWIHHGETMVADDNADVQEHIDDDDLEDDPETLRCLSQYSAEFDAQMDRDFGNEQGGGDAGGWDRNDDDGGVDNDGGAHEGDIDDFDNLEDIIRAVGPEILKRKRSRKSREGEKSIKGDSV
jgi:hypothetical protein